MVQAFRVVLIVLDVVWSLYLIAAPVELLTVSPVWREALRVVPFNSPDVLGFAFLTGPVLAAGSALYSIEHRTGRAAYVLACLAWGLTGACWGLVAVSWAAAAIELDGNGVGSTGIAFGLVALHGLLAFERHPRRQVAAQVRQRLGEA